MVALRKRVVLAAAALAVAAALGACGGGGKAAFGSDIAKRVDTIQLGDKAWDPIDATTSPDGKTAYFTGTGPNGPGVFRVPSGGGAVEAIATGSPFKTPVGVAVSTDGSRLYVADAGAGSVFSVGTAGSGGAVPVAVAGTAGLAPRGVEVVPVGGKDTVYFTGRDASGAVGVFLVVPGQAAPAAAATTVAKGSPLTDPDAVTATRDGVVYVTDRGGAVYRVRPGGAAEKVADLRAPKFAGVTLTLDESTLLVSSLSAKGTDQVLVVELASGRTGVFNKTIGANVNGGGLHRAHQVNEFAWADVLRPGRIYVIGG